jgi:hypothetical protein
MRREGVGKMSKLSLARNLLGVALALAVVVLSIGSSLLPTSSTVSCSDGEVCDEANADDNLAEELENFTTHCELLENTVGDGCPAGAVADCSDFTTNDVPGDSLIVKRYWYADYCTANPGEDLYASCAGFDGSELDFSGDDSCPGDDRGCGDWGGGEPTTDESGNTVQCVEFRWCDGDCFSTGEIEFRNGNVYKCLTCDDCDQAIQDGIDANCN